MVVIPIRSFRDAKTRLADVLSSSDRERLAEAMATRVVAAAHELAVHVVTEDETVARWAAGLGAHVIDPGVRGLNAAVAAAQEILRQQLDPAQRMIVAHADLPMAEDLRVVTGPGVAVAPDAARDGSNVLSLPVGAGFSFRYGPGSFAAHRIEAESRGLPFTVVSDGSLALDIDDPTDLAALADPPGSPGRR